MPSNCRAIATFGWDTGDTVTHGRAIATYGWGVDSSPAPMAESHLSAESTIMPGEFSPTDIRRAFSKLNDIFARRYSIDASILPSALQTQNAIVIAYGTTLITACANADDAVTLPPAKANGYCKVINATALNVQVFPGTDDAIDGAAADASMTLTAGNVGVFEAVDATDWYSYQQ